MSTPPDKPHDPGAEAAARIGSILANAEREVARIVQEAQQSSKDDLARIEVRTRMLDERTVELNALEADIHSRGRHLDSRTLELDGRATELDRRATELADLTAGLLSTAVGVQTYARRLAALRPLTADGPSLDEIVPEVPRFDAAVRSAVEERSSRPAAPAAPAVPPEEPAVDEPPASRPRTAPRPQATDTDETPVPSTPAALRAVDQLQDDGRWDRPKAAPASATPATTETADTGTAATPDRPVGPADPAAAASAAPAAPVEAPAADVPAAPVDTTPDVAPAASVAPTAPADAAPAEPVAPAAAPVPPVAAEPETPTGPRPVPDAVDADEPLPIVAGSETAKDSPEQLDSARLVALSMAAEGRSREEVEAHVRDTLGIIEHAALIDYVFGGSTPSSVVPSWPPRRRRRS
ncbi:hypothetical protein [Patulibacter minatonensis]|uniref:hypothetical protein n=1 Tax=Patulibacter minatonensis TaxID=298163 RepID=UPI00047C8CDE|nr:hypothetical protein [Patulibacter minatonensis]